MISYVKTSKTATALLVVCGSDSETKKNDLLYRGRTGLKRSGENTWKKGPILKASTFDLSNGLLWSRNNFTTLNPPIIDEKVCLTRF